MTHRVKDVQFFVASSESETLMYKWQSLPLNGFSREGETINARLEYEHCRLASEIRHRTPSGTFFFNFSA